MAGMLSNLPAFENCIMQKYGILSMLEKDSLSSSGSVADTEQFNKRLFKMICKFLYEECNAIFKEVFEDYSSDRSKEVARNNVRSLAGADHIEEVNKLSAKVYGEVEFFSFCNLLERIGIQKGEVLYDLGHGTGKAMVAASLLFGDKLKLIKGIELLPDLNDISVKAIEKYISLINSPEYSVMFESKRECTLCPLEGDFLTDTAVAEWTNADIVFANSTCFNSELMVQIANFAVQMRSGSRLITFTYPLPSESFQMTEKINLGMSWGLATCYIHISFLMSNMYGVASTAVTGLPNYTAPAAIDTKKALAAVLESLSKVVTVAPSFVPVTDLIYVQRLEKALQKNFDYIRRKDSGQLKPTQKKPDQGAKSSGQGYQKDNSSNNIRPGIGSNQQVGSVANVNIQSQLQLQLNESVSIYVSGLPTDIDEKDLEILFGSQGSIKKIKIYTTPAGVKKGDALITYTRAEAAGMAVIQYNNLNIGEGCIISVSRASFTPAVIVKEDVEQIPEPVNDPVSINIASEVQNMNATPPNNAHRLRDALPPECLAATHPIALLSRVYDPISLECLTDPNFFMDLEADMLVECCKFGKVVRLVSPEGVLFDHLGCIAVTFESLQSARDCASSLHGRWFDSRQIETLVFSPPDPSPSSSSAPSSSAHTKDNLSHDNSGSGSDNQVTSRGFNSDSSSYNTTSTSTTNYTGNNGILDPAIPTNSNRDSNRDLPPEEPVDESPDVDDFLNSFL